MLYNRSIRQYNDVHNASVGKEDIVLMLYDGSIRFLKQAAIHIAEARNAVEKVKLINRTIKIIDYLQSCLDHEKGGEIAFNLNRLYDYMVMRLAEANMQNDASKIEEVIRLISTIREGWVKVCEEMKTNRGLPVNEMTTSSKGPKNLAVSI